MKIGICGGTFDPFHRGHLEPVLAARETMQWDRIIYMVAHRQPFKVDGDSASGYHRFAMAVLATVGIDDVWISSWELEREGVSYTVDTLEYLRGEFPEATLDWIIGDDNLARLGEWRNVERIFGLANFAVLSRGVEASSTPSSDSGGVSDLRPPGSGLRAPVKPATAPECICAPADRPPYGAIVYAQNAAIPVSSTDIRRRVRAGESIDALVDPRVSRYIQRNRLYQETH
jgi:nicotinate-nucleotide adenylyltransferase